LQPKKIALLARDAASDKKAEDPIILDLAKLTDIAHYFVITHGNSERQVRAIADHVVGTLKEHKIPVWHLEGMDDGKWVLIDFGMIIVHVFYREIREFYNLERLWGDAPRIE
jgi:ribosome-associated protein